jgi:hypothetical protein
MNRKCLPIALASIVAGWLAGCANQQPTQSGFISDYRSLRPIDSFGKVLEQRPDPSTLVRYSSVYVEPVLNRLPSDIAPADAANLADLTAKALKAELAKQWAIVESPGHGTIRVRSALTAVRKSNPPVNVVLTAVAVPLINGGLSAEAEFFGGVPPRRIGAISWADEGRLNPVGYYSELGHPRELTKDFARAVAAVLDRSGTRKPH